MNRTTNSFLKGMGAGVIAGAAMLTAGKMMMDSKNTKRALTKGTSKAFRAVGDFVEGVQTLMKQNSEKADVAFLKKATFFVLKIIGKNYCKFAKICYNYNVYNKNGGILEMINSRLKRLLALIICFTLLFCNFSTDAFAAETEIQLSLNTSLSGALENYSVEREDEELVESIKTQLMNFEERVDIYDFKLKNTKENQQKIIDILSGGIPECFHIELAFSMTPTLDGYLKTINPRYSYSKDEYEVMLEECDAAADKMLEGIEGNGSLTDVEKLLLLHDRIAIHCEYDYERYLMGQIPQISYSMYGVFVNKVAVCQGYSLAYAYMLDRIGIENYYCNSKKLNHAWNIVYVNGKPYHVDITWDDVVWDVTGQVVHDNFLVSTETLKRNMHDADDFDSTPTDTAYDDYFWNNSETAFTLLNDEIYYIDNINNHIVRYSDQKSIYDIDEFWMANPGAYWPGDFARLSTDGKDLLFSLSDGIYKLDVKNGKATLIHKPELVDYFRIYGFAYEDGMLVYDLSLSPVFDHNTKKLYEHKVPYTAVEPLPYLPGDIDNNQEVDLQDVARLAQVVAGWQVDYNESACNANGDTSINLTDVVHLSQYVAGWSGIELH